MTRSGILVRLVVFAGAVVLAGSACGENGKQNGKTHATTAGGTAIQIMNFQFMPPNLTVKPGATVTWTNEDTAVHGIKDTSPLATPVSQDLGKGATFSITYAQPGTYSYICNIHQYMTGSVTVGP